MALTDEQRRRMKWIQNDMAIEGFVISDQRMEQIMEAHQKTGENERIGAAFDRAVAQGEKEGRDYGEIFFQWLKADLGSPESK